MKILLVPRDAWTADELERVEAVTNSRRSPGSVFLGILPVGTLLGVKVEDGGLVGEIRFHRWVAPETVDRLGLALGLNRFTSEIRVIRIGGTPSPTPPEDLGWIVTREAAA